MPIAKYPSGSSAVPLTVEPSSGVFNVDCSAATDFYLNLNNSYYLSTVKPAYVGGKVAAFAGATSNYTVSLTDLAGGLSTSPQEGDIVVAAITFARTDQTFNITGYTQVADLFISGTRNTNLFVGYKRMTSSPDTQIVFTGGSFESVAGASIAIHVWRNINKQTILDISATTLTSINTNIPTFTAVTPATSGSEIIVIGGSNGGSGAATYSATGLLNFLSIGSSDTESSSIGIGSYSYISGSYTPSQWTGGQTSSSSSAAVILTLKPRYPSNVDINFINVPTTYKEINLFGNVNSNSPGFRELTWDTDLIKLVEANTLLFPGQSLYYELFTQAGSIFLKQSIGSQKTEKKVEITSTKNWTVPSDVTQIEITLCGGGGGGTSGTPAGAGSGSVIREILTVDPGQQYLITIGAGGAGGSIGSSGSSSSFGSLLTVAGGGGGANQINTPGGVGGYGVSTDPAYAVRVTGIDGYGHGGNSQGGNGYVAPANTGIGGNGNTTQSGSSGVAIIKYWSAL